MIELELDDRSADLAGTIDRFLSGRSRDPIATVVAGALNGILGRVVGVSQQRARGQAQQPLPRSPSSQQQHRPPPPRRPPEDPTIKAREILGFEPGEPLTAERVHKRKQALAKVFHPDLPSGSAEQMRRINTAADALLAKLA